MNFDNEFTEIHVLPSSCREVSPWSALVHARGSAWTVYQLWQPSCRNCRELRREKIWLVTTKLPKIGGKKKKKNCGCWNLGEELKLSEQIAFFSFFVNWRVQRRRGRWNSLTRMLKLRQIFDRSLKIGTLKNTFQWSQCRFFLADPANPQYNWTYDPSPYPYLNYPHLNCCYPYLSTLSLICGWVRPIWKICNWNQIMLIRQRIIGRIYDIYVGMLWCFRS